QCGDHRALPEATFRPRTGECVRLDFQLVERHRPEFVDQTYRCGIAACCGQVGPRERPEPVYRTDRTKTRVQPGEGDQPRTPHHVDATNGVGHAFGECGDSWWRFHADTSVADSRSP